MLDVSAPILRLPLGRDEEQLRARRTSSWTLKQKLARVLWMFAWRALFRSSFHNFYGWRRWLLRRFGATVGRNVRIRPSVWVEIPWNLVIGDESVVGDGAIVYSLA